MKGLKRRPDEYEYCWEDSLPKTEFGSQVKEIDKEEAKKLGYLFDDTIRTKLIRFNDEIIEVDFRRRVSHDGSRLTWVKGMSPKLAKGLANRAPKGKGPKAPPRPSTIIKKIFSSKATYGELKDIPESSRLELEELMGGQLTRGDVAIFKQVARAVEGDFLAFKEIMDRIEGKAVQKNENMNVNANYTDFLKSKAEVDESSDDDDIIDV